MEQLLRAINIAVADAGGKLCQETAEIYRLQYRGVLEKGQIECPPLQRPPGKAKRGRLKRSKARNLLERLINYESDVLRFMDNALVPFTNNRGENDIRMTKVHQKVFGCFHSIEGAKVFCRVRGYLSSCRKQNINASEAMRRVFEGELPALLNVSD
ncbi:MAG: transposase [Neolewinella sp.]|jgi:transposase